jgi:hypothetical protein
MDYNDQYEIHPEFPLLQAGVPLTYTLTMKACLSNKYTERPSFSQVLQLLNDVQIEVAKGRYMDGTGRVQVCVLQSPVWAYSLPYKHGVYSCTECLFFMSAARSPDTKHGQGEVTGEVHTGLVLRRRQPAVDLACRPQWHFLRQFGLHKVR